MVYCLSLEYQYPSECLTVRLVCDSDSLIITRRCRESIPVPHSPKHHPLQFEVHPVNMSAITWPSVYLLSTRIIYTCTYSCQCTSYSVVLNILFNTHTHTYIFTLGIISAFPIPYAVHLHVPVMCLKIFIHLKKEIMLVNFILSFFQLFEKVLYKFIFYTLRPVLCSNCLHVI